MENKIKILFNKLNLREKALLTFVVWCIVFVWISGTLDSTSELRANWRLTGDALRSQEDTLERATKIKSEFNERWQELKPDQTFTSRQLAAKVDSIARMHGVVHSFGTPKSKVDGF